MLLRCVCMASGWPAIIGMPSCHRLICSLFLASPQGSAVRRRFLRACMYDWPIVIMEHWEDPLYWVNDLTRCPWMTFKVTTRYGDSRKEKAKYQINRIRLTVNSGLGIWDNTYASHTSDVTCSASLMFNVAKPCQNMHPYWYLGWCKPIHEAQC